MSSVLFQVRLQKTLRHFLDAGIIVLRQPGGVGQVEGQFAVDSRAMIAFANVNQPDRTSWLIPEAHPAILRSGPFRGGNGQADGIPVAFGWCPTATASVAEIAESLQNILGRNLAIMAGGGAMALPSAPQRKPCRMRPIAFEFLFGHEIRASQIQFLSDNGFVGSGYCIRSWER
jgi:hypothetical protein